MIGNRTRLLLCVALVVAGVAAMAVWAGVAAADAPTFSITGHVTDTTGAPIQNVHVIVYRNTVSGTVNSPWFAAEDEYTDANGDYTITYPTGYWENDGPNDPGYAGTYAVLFWPRLWGRTRSTTGRSGGTVCRATSPTQTSGSGTGRRRPSRRLRRPRERHHHDQRQRRPGAIPGHHRLHRP